MILPSLLISIGLSFQAEKSFCVTFCMKTLFKMNATWFCIFLFTAMAFSIQTLLGDSFLNQRLRWNWIFSGKSDRCTYKSLLSHLQDVAVVLWLIWGCFSGIFQRIIQRKELFLLSVVIQGRWTRWNAFVWCQMRKAWKRIGVMEWVIERWGWLLPRVQQKFSCITLGKLVRRQWRETNEPWENLERTREGPN